MPLIYTREVGLYPDLVWMEVYHSNLRTLNYLKGSFGQKRVPIFRDFFLKCLPIHFSQVLGVAPNF